MPGTEGRIGGQPWPPTGYRLADHLFIAQTWTRFESENGVITNTLDRLKRALSWANWGVWLVYRPENAGEEKERWTPGFQAYQTGKYES